MVDLDGNGENELLTDQNQLFFQREGSLYAADITALLEANWPEMTWWDYSLIDTSRRCLAITGFARETNAPADSETQFNFIRYCYFDGENLLFYNDTTSCTDHVSDSIDAPDYALTAARDRYLRTWPGGRPDLTAQQAGTTGASPASPPWIWENPTPPWVWRSTPLAMSSTLPRRNT